MRVISSGEVNEVAGSLSVVGDLTAIAVGGSLSMFGFDPISSGMVGYAAGSAIDYDMSNAAAAAAINSAYTTGAAL